MPIGVVDMAYTLKRMLCRNLSKQAAQIVQV